MKEEMKSNHHSLSNMYKALTAGEKGHWMKAGMSVCGLAFVDKLVSYPAEEIEKKKQIEFIEALAKRIENLENIENNEQFYLSFKRAALSVSESDQRKKVKGFALILSKAVNEKLANWDEPQQAMKIQENLEDRHIEVLAQISNLGTEQFVVGKKVDGFPDLFCNLPNVSPMLIQLILMDLIAQGLINDTDVDRSKGEAVSYFKLSEAGKWFIDFTLSE